MISPNKVRYIVNEHHKDTLKGLKLFSLKNSKGSYVIPSTKNFVDTYQIKKIKCDDGSTCTVLPIENVTMLLDLFVKYEGNCDFTITPVAGETLALTITDL